MTKKKSYKKKKPLQQVKQIYKTIRGKRYRYVNVNIKKAGKTVNKQYRYRGGKFSTYLDEARIPKGTKYFIDYGKDRIITNPREIDALVKKVRGERKAQAKRPSRLKKKKKKDILKELRIIPKKTYHPPKPVEAEKIIKMLTGKIYYEREHSIREFSTLQQQQRFLSNIISKGTKNKRHANVLVQNFDKIKLKISYAVVIEGVNADTGREEQLGVFTAIGMKPLEIKQWLAQNDLLPSEEFKEMGYGLAEKLATVNGHANISGGRYRITDVKLAVKFYNNPQQRLSK